MKAEKYLTDFLILCKLCRLIVALFQDPHSFQITKYPNPPLRASSEHFSLLIHSSTSLVVFSHKIINSTMKLFVFVGIVLGCTLGALAQGPKVTDIVSILKTLEK